MKTLYILLISLLFNQALVFSQCQENEETKILLVGDSWAFFMGVDGTIDNIMEDWGHSGNKFYTNLTLAQNGAKTTHFKDQEKKDEIASQLLNKPSIEYVHLSLAGNDLLGNWKSQTFTQEQTDSLMAVVVNDLIEVVDYIKSVRSDIIIVLSGYTYPNFEEVIQDFYIPSLHPFYSNWDNMEQPSNAELNTKLNEFTDILAVHYATDSRVHFVPATGITQYTYGQLDPLGVSPFGTYAPFSVSLPYGDPAYPSPMNSMRNYQVTKDCFHLSQQGYEDLIGYTTQKYYHKAMMSDKYLIAENPLTNGSVSSESATSSSLLLGENNGTHHQTIITFETLYNIDSIAAEASLFLHIREQTGANPMDESVQVEINDGAFGVSATIEVADYSEVGKALGNPCVFGSNEKGTWVRLDLPQNLLEYITVNDITQFKLSAPNASSALIEFSGVDDVDFAPVLNITYGNEAVTQIAEEELQPQVLIYPNPTNGMLNIDVEYAQVLSLKVRSIDGKEMQVHSTSQVDLSELSPGTYLVQVLTNKGVITQKVIKE